MISVFKSHSLATYVYWDVAIWNLNGDYFWSIDKRIQVLSIISHLLNISYKCNTV